jgi:hypothetical protein
MQNVKAKTLEKTSDVLNRLRKQELKFELRLGTAKPLAFELLQFIIEKEATLDE